VVSGHARGKLTLEKEKQFFLCFAFHLFFNFNENIFFIKQLKTYLGGQGTKRVTSKA